MRTTIATALLFACSAAFAHGFGPAHGPGGCMGYGPGTQAGPGPMCEGAMPNAALHEKMQSEMLELRRLYAQGGDPEVYAQQLKKVQEARLEMRAARGEGPQCMPATFTPPSAK
jgi:hypothetical protein